MIKPILLLAVSTLASSVQAQLATFSGVNFTGPFIEGQNYTLSWTLGNGQDVSANLLSGNYSQPIFVDLPVQSDYVFTIPDPIAEGTYSVELLQGGNQSDRSPLFSIFMAPSNTSANATALTVAPTGTGFAEPTTYAYYDEHCGCTKTGLVPAVTAASTGTKYTGPAMTTPATPPISTYTGTGTTLQAAWFLSPVVGAISLAMFA